MELTSLVVLSAITFAGSLVQAALGFGFAILAAPLFLVVMNSTAAVPVLAVLNLAVSAFVAARTWTHAPRRLLGILCAGSVAGFPIGLALFRHADVAELKLATGVVIMLFALALLARERRRSASTDRSIDAYRPSIAVALLMGTLSGAMGAALAMPGPVAMLYVSTARLSKDHSRALSLAFFSFVYAGVCLLHGWHGSLGREHLWLATKLVIAVIAGAVAGHGLARHLSEERFRLLVLVTLFGAGLYAALSA